MTGAPSGTCPLRPSPVADPSLASPKKAAEVFDEVITDESPRRYSDQHPIATSPGTFEFRQLHAALDCGAVQSDALTISPDQSLEAYERIQTQRTTLLDREVAWLRTLGGRGRGPGNCLPIVATDVVPLACAAARTAGLPCVCVSNFTWVDIYEAWRNLEGVTAAWEDRWAPMLTAIATDYRCATLLLRLPGHTAMAHFGADVPVADVPLLVRRSRRPASVTRAALGLDPHAPLLVVMFGGQAMFPHKPPAPHTALPPGWVCAFCHTAWPDGGEGVEGEGRYVRLPRACYLPDVIEAAQAVLGKIG